MKYSDCRDQIRTGDTLAWTHRKLESWYDVKVMIVRLAQVSEYAHVGTAVVMAGRVWVLEAVVPKVRLVPLSNLLPCYHLTSDGMSAAEIEPGIALVGKEGVEYSQWEAIKAFFGDNNPLDGNIECAELVNFLRGHPCKATPSEVVRFEMEAGAMLTEIQP